MARFIYLLLALVTLLGCQEPFLGDGEDDMRIDSQTAGWSTAGTLTSLDTDKNVHMQVDFPDSGPYTLQFSQETDSTAGGDFITIAEIDWKVEGNWVHRTINVTDGVSISGTGEAVKVSIRDLSQTFVSRDYLVSVQLAKGTRAAIQQPPTYKSDYIESNLIPNGTQTYTIPQGCGVVSAWFSAYDTDAPFPIIPTAGTVVALIESLTTVTMIADVTDSRWIPIPAGSVRIRIINSNAHGVKVTAPLYGIDG